MDVHRVYISLEFSTVKFSPESFSYPEHYLANNETEEDANYLQNVITSLVDHKQVLRVIICLN